MKAQDVQRAIMGERYRRHFCLPNYTPSGWWECDVFELTKAGYFVEYEIKLTRGDFRADRSKQKTGFEWDEQTRRFSYPPGPNKHQQLAERQTCGPSRFYFVCPAEVAAVPDIPDWAGLIHCRTLDPKFGYGANKVMLQTVVEAPTLHQQKADSKIALHAQGVCYWRLLNLLTGRLANGWEEPSPEYHI